MPVRDDEIAAALAALYRRPLATPTPPMSAPARPSCLWCVLTLALIGASVASFVAVGLAIGALPPLRLPPWAHFVVLASAGGVANYLNLFREGRGWHVGEFAAHVAVSAFAGVLLAMLVEAAGLNRDFVPLACLLGGWMGARGVALAERVLENMTGGRK